jgi:hypothetical protein
MPAMTAKNRRRVIVIGGLGQKSQDSARRRPHHFKLLIL